MSKKFYDVTFALNGEVTISVLADDEKSAIKQADGMLYEVLTNNFDSHDIDVRECIADESIS